MPNKQDDANWAQSPAISSSSNPIDHEHLHRITMGDKNLEREVLAMFLNQSAKYLARLAELPEHAGDVAHSLKGAALSIGAVRVAEAAQELEMTLFRGENAEAAVVVLARHVEEARARIKRMLAFL